MSEIQTEFLFEARIPLHPPISAGDGPNGPRGIYLVNGGRFEGPRLKGEVIPDSGGDWVTVRSDGAADLQVRITLKTDDGALIYVHWHGIMVAAPEDLDYALDFAKLDDPEGASRYYFRTAPRFETGDPRYAWLNRLVAVGKGRTGDGGVVYRVFAVK